MMDLNKAAFAQSSGCVEWYTPRYIWDRALRVMGDIDLDPASNLEKNIPAKKYYMVCDNGLLQPWSGRIWLNPPYGDGVVEWFKKLKTESDVTEAIVLWKAATETEGWRVLTSFCTKICLPNKRVAFKSVKNVGANAPTFSPVLFYVGNHEELFKSVYGEIGQVWDVPKDLKCREQTLLWGVDYEC